jgi:signal transduction histidine kinase
MMVSRVWTWLTKHGLRWHIQLLTVVSLLVVFAFFWWTGQQTIEESIQQSLDNQLVAARLAASSLDHRLNTVLTVLEKTAADLNLTAGSPTDTQVSLLKDTQLQLSVYGQLLIWLDTDGSILWTEPHDTTLLSQPLPDFSIVRPAMKGVFRFVSNLCRSADSPQPYILLAVPVPQPSGQVSSLLFEKIDADQLGLNEILDQAMPGSESYIEVIDHEGTVLASSVVEARCQKQDHAVQFTNLIDNQQPMVGTCHQCHVGEDIEDIHQIEEVLAFAPLRVAPWGVAIRQPSSKVMAPIGHLRRQMLLGGGAVLVATLLAVSWFVTRQIVSPIQELDAASAQFADGNLDMPIASNGNDEIANLAANLERMRVRLEATLEDHRRWNEALEELVDERTRKLSVLYEQLQGKEVMVSQLLAKVLTAQEEERARLARELHDTIGQSLTAIIMTTTAVEDSLPTEYVSGKEKLGNVRVIATQALQDLRNLIFNLRPETLDDLGLVLALRSQAKECLEPTGVRVQIRSTRLNDRLPPEVEMSVFRVVQEAITNIARHDQASEASILLTRKDGRLVVRVEDDGVGFNLEQLMDEKKKGWGIRGMEERITLLGGKFYIGSQPSKGTLVLAEVPLDPTEDL